MKKKNRRTAIVKLNEFKGLRNYTIEIASKTIGILPALPYALYRNWQKQKLTSNRKAKYS